MFHKNPARARAAYARFVEEGIGRRKPPVLHAGLWFGTESFGERIRLQIEAASEDSEHPRSVRLAVRPTLESCFPKEWKADKVLRDAGIVRAYREERYTQSEIARFVGLHYVTVSGVIREWEREDRRGKG